MTTCLALRLEPLDTLFFRDGRPFAAATRAEGGLPQPRTLAGALRTRLVAQSVDLRRLPELRRRGVPIEDALGELGCPPWVLRTRFRGPWLARGRGAEVEPLVPAPVILSREGDTLFRLAPLEPKQLPGGWPDPHGLWPLWRAGGADARPVGGFLGRRGLQTFLAGGVPEVSDLVKAEDLYGFDDRTGLAITPDTLTGMEGMLYGIRLLALQREVSLYAEVLPGADAPADLAARLEGPVPLGGEGRYVRVEVLGRPCAWPEAPAGPRSLWLLASPAPLKQAHAPDNLRAGAAVRAAATAAPLAFSGWDVARNGPEKTRFAVPAGAVYFVEGEFAPDQGSLCVAEDAAVGWGLALRGTWT
jgi:CRISPR-associated protein Cmr3